MNLNEKDHINYAKNELRNYKFLINAKTGVAQKIDVLITEMESYKTSPIKFEGSEGGSSNNYWKSKKGEELISLEDRFEGIIKRVANIETFLNSLNEHERKIITNIYIKGKSFKSQTFICNMSERNLKYEVDKLMLNFEIM